MPQRNREPRKSVRIGVRLKDDAGWSDAHILNVSSRGVMAQCQDPPPRGSYIEIRRGTYMMIGRVAWSGTDRIGIRVREQIDLEDLLLPVTPGRKAPRRANEVQMRVCERRKPSVEERAATSARFARVFDFAALAIIVVGLAIFASGMAARAFGSPMAEVEMALKGTP